MSEAGREWWRGATVCHMPPHFGLCKCCRWRRLRCAVDMARKSNRIIQFQYKDDDDKSQPKSTVDRERETRARRDKHERAQTGKGSLGNCIHKQIQFHVPQGSPQWPFTYLVRTCSPFPAFPSPPHGEKKSDAALCVNVSPSSTHYSHSYHMPCNHRYSRQSCLKRLIENVSVCVSV